MSEMYENKDQTVSIGEWIVTYIITALPIVGIIMLFVWAFGSDAKTSKKNWAIAALIMAVIGIVIWIIFAVLFASVFAGIYENMFEGMDFSSIR